VGAGEGGQRLGRRKQAREKGLGKKAFTKKGSERFAEAKKEGGDMRGRKGKKQRVGQYSRRPGRI